MTDFKGTISAFNLKFLHMVPVTNMRRRKSRSIKIYFVSFLNFNQKIRTYCLGLIQSSNILLHYLNLLISKCFNSLESSHDQQLRSLKILVLMKTSKRENVSAFLCYRAWCPICAWQRTLLFCHWFCGRRDVFVSKFLDVLASTLMSLVETCHLLDIRVMRRDVLTKKNLPSHPYDYVLSLRSKPGRLQTFRHFIGERRQLYFSKLSFPNFFLLKLYFPKL